jgi:hypothetical protein
LLVQIFFIYFGVTRAFGFMMTALPAERGAETCYLRLYGSLENSPEIQGEFTKKADTRRIYGKQMLYTISFVSPEKGRPWRMHQIRVLYPR